ncbi:MAG: DbpA RNA binding domain-containing protein [Treponema sp.]|jgi:hypothetical protein|nr:DbpA RNA binding domain-containing protein [Treponema sp.]
MKFDEESIKNRIRTLLEEIHTEADPELLNRCRAVFRREVSFFSRSYMAAYLLLLADQDTKRPAGREGKKRPSGGEWNSAGRSQGRGAGDSAGRTAGEAASAGRAQEESRTVLPEEESVRLFISVGRNRKVFPREILALINAKAQIAKDDVGIIRILDNYSFVQVREAAAERIIGALSGQNFRGRTLTVNYARTKRDGDDGESAETGNGDLPGADGE